MSGMQRKLRQALGAVKDQTSIGLARVLSNIGIPDLEVAIVKATSHDEVGMDEKYVHEILFLVSNSPGSVSALAMGLAKRFDRTHNWIVALKGLMLIHRLLRGGDRNFEEELRRSRSQGLLNLNLSNFRDSSPSISDWDFVAFLRSYSQFLDERMDWSITPAGKLENASGYGLISEEIFNVNPMQEVKSTEKKILEMVLDRLPKSQVLLDRVIACRPTGLARSNRLVQIALNSVVRESFQLYSNVCEGIASLIDAFFDMEYQHCALAFDIYKKAASQSHQLSVYFDLCKDMNVCGSFEYPAVEKICQEHVDTLEEFMKNRFESKSVVFSKDGSPVAAAKSEPEFIPRRRSFGCGRRDFSNRNGNARDAEYIDSKGNYKERSSVFSFESAPVNYKQRSGRIEPRNGGFGMEKPRKLEEDNADLLQVDKPTISVEEHENRLALALFSTHSQTKISTNWENFNTTSDQQTCASISRKGSWNFNTSPDQHTGKSISGKGVWNFNTSPDQQTCKSISGKGSWNLNTNSDQQTCKSISGKGSWNLNTNSDQQICNSISGKGGWNFNAKSDEQACKSTSPTGKPGWELALLSTSGPLKSGSSATFNNMAAGGFDDLLLDSLYDHADQSAKKFSSSTPTEDPFAASASIPPPAYVQIDEMKKKQSYLLQEQQLWQQYQSEGMHGYCGFVQLYNNPSCAPGSSIPDTPNLLSYGPMAGSSMLPHYNMGGFAFY